MGHNCSMVLHGRVANGVIVIEGNLPLPEGAAVSVSYPAAPLDQSAQVSLNGRQAALDELERLRNLPNENPGDDFDAADHDRELYGSAG